MRRRRSMPAGRRRLIQRVTLHRGAIIRLIRETLELNGRRMIRETVQHPGAVVILPMLDASQIVFVRQYRRAVGRSLLELPAGTLTAGERPLACARRELEEETGWRARRMRRLIRFYAAPGFSSEQMTLFLAQDLRWIGARPDPDEFVQPVVLSLKAARAKIASGAICDAKSIIGVLLASPQGLKAVY